MCSGVLTEHPFSEAVLRMDCLMFGTMRRLEFLPIFSLSPVGPSVSSHISSPS